MYGSLKKFACAALGDSKEMLSAFMVDWLGVETGDHDFAEYELNDT
jgi:hypothetical protein